ncbi:MAG: polysulfide reductase NrfD [Eggerthellaceae bacterium]|nr:polysulfide reductase NrfD [Eggerthellaceae bacterium]
MAEIQTVWGWLVASDLFLGGLSAGVFCTASILRLAGKGSFRSTLTYGAWFATIALALALTCLLSDVGMPFRALILWQSFSHATSWMAIGAWVLFTAFIIFLATALLSTKKITKGFSELAQSRVEVILKVLAVIGICASLGVALYTGILLASATGIPLWKTWLLPALFVTSALYTGVAAVLIFVVIGEKDPRAEKVKTLLTRIILVLIVLEAAVLAYFLVTKQGGSLSEQLASGLIVNGSLTIAFWVLVVAVGLAIPLLVGIVGQFLPKGKEGSASKAGAIVPATAAVFTLIGGFSLRFIILAAGIHAAMIIPTAAEAAKGLFFFMS